MGLVGKNLIGTMSQCILRDRFLRVRRIPSMLETSGILGNVIDVLVLFENCCIVLLCIYMTLCENATALCAARFVG